MQDETKKRSEKAAVDGNYNSTHDNLGKLGLHSGGYSCRTLLMLLAVWAAIMSHIGCMMMELCMKGNQQIHRRSVMGRILEAFAADELHVIPSKEIRSPKRQELCDKACNLQEKLEEKLNNEEKELLNELMDAIADENCSYARSKFIKGYRLGVLMTMEVMSEQESFLGRSISEQADFIIKMGGFVWRG